MELRDSAHIISYARNDLTADPQRLSNTLLRLTDRYRYWMFAAVLVVYLLGFNGQWRVERDSALYLNIGRNWAEGHGPTYRGQPNHLVFPGLPILLNLTFRVFGTGSFLPPLVLMLLLGWTTLAVNYRLFLIHVDRPTAVVMTVGLGLTRLFYRYCFEVLTDLPFLLGLMAFLAGYEAIFSPRAKGRPAKWLDWVLLIGGLVVAISMRPVMWVLVVAIGLTVVWRIIRGQITWRLIALSAGLAVAVTAFYILDVGRHSKGVDDYEATVINRLHDIPGLLRQVPANLSELLPQAALVKALFGCRLPVFMNVGLGVLVLVLSFTLFDHRALWGFLVSCTFAMLVLFQQPLDRYFVAVIPLLIYAWWRFMVWVNHRLPAHWGNWLFLVLFFGGMGCNLARIGEMILEQRCEPFLKSCDYGRMPFLASYRFGRYESLDRVGELIRTHTHEHDWIVAGPDQARILTLITRRNVVENMEKNIPIGHHAVFALMGPSWGDSSDPRHADPVRASADWEKTRDATQLWLVTRGLTFGPPVTDKLQGPHDRMPWILYQTLPAGKKE